MSKQELERAVTRIAKEGGHPESWVVVRHLGSELDRLLEERHNQIRSLVLSAQIIRVDGHHGVMVAVANTFNREVGHVLADEAPARFALVISHTQEGLREGRLYAAKDCKVEMAAVARPFDGSGEASLALIPKMPASWYWGVDLESQMHQWSTRWEMT